MEKVKYLERLKTTSECCLNCPSNENLLPLSIEPQLERIDLLMPPGHLSMIDWIIVGAESGSKKRYCESKWIRDIFDQGQAVSIPVFVKQFHYKKVSSDIRFKLVNKVKLDFQQFPKELKLSTK